MESRSLVPGSQAQTVKSLSVRFFEYLTNLFMEYAKITGRPVALNDLQYFLVYHEPLKSRSSYFVHAYGLFKGSYLPFLKSYLGPRISGSDQVHTKSRSKFPNAQVRYGQFG